MRITPKRLVEYKLNRAMTYEDAFLLHEARIKGVYRQAFRMLLDKYADIIMDEPVKLWELDLIAHDIDRTLITL